MSKEFIKECFDNLSVEELQINNKIIDQVPKEMQTVGKMNWRYIKSSVTTTQIKDIEKKYNIVFPSIYKDFISVYAHFINKVQGKLDNFLFEEDVDVVLEIPEQPYGAELQKLELLLESNEKYLYAGFLPIGEFQYCGLMCIDIFGNDEDTMKIMWFDHEDCCECESREELEDEGAIVFDNFKLLLKCFFLKEKYDCKNKC